MNQIVVGLAGHIDHGKTALVRALTGVNTDKLKEEIQRGMTIDIGFAFMSEKITLIDVPGHEKFVKNMMAGVSSVDAALLVIAADDGVMPQTREHLDILRLLDVKTGCIALNKADMADEDWLDLVESDIHDLVDGTFLQDAPIIRTSATKNTGITELTKAILDMSADIPLKSDRGVFRLNIDRVFSIKGFGTVATGTVSSGELTLGETVDILPQNKMAKVRGLQSHTQKIEKVVLGDRAAVNLANIEKFALSRGNVLAAPGYFQSTRQIGASLKLLPRTSKPVVQNQRVRFHLGTQEVMARVAIIGEKLIQPGEEAPVILRLESPLVPGYGDRFIIRTYSPIDTIGGGEILLNIITDKWKIASEKVHDLYRMKGIDRIVREVESWKTLPLNESRAKLAFGYSIEKLDEWVDSDDRLEWIQHKTDRWLVADIILKDLRRKVLNLLKKFQEKYPYRLGPQKEEIRQNTKTDPRFLEYSLDVLVKEGALMQEGEFFHLPGHSIQLSSAENQLMEHLLTLLSKEKYNSSSITVLSTKMGESEKQIKLLLDIAEQQGKILRLEGHLMFTRQNFDQLKNEVISFFNTNEILSISEFKDIAGTSRKYAMPLLEYFDQKKITYRTADGRKLIK
ncbi:MAG: selenocysteine-specific translation elongation factor [Candidatus Marinimicrobia bacterium]|nr:selenocysteine-specific translation elongation factor [Candidatus Neomarinimicrobiota bacterium]